MTHAKKPCINNTLCTSILDVLTVDCLSHLQAHLLNIDFLTWVSARQVCSLFWDISKTKHIFLAALELRYQTLLQQLPKAKPKKHNELCVLTDFIRKALDLEVFQNWSVDADFVQLFADLFARKDYSLLCSVVMPHLPNKVFQEFLIEPSKEDITKCINQFLLNCLTRSDPDDVDDGDDDTTYTYTYIARFATDNIDLVVGFLKQSLCVSDIVCHHILKNNSLLEQRTLTLKSLHKEDLTVLQSWLEDTTSGQKEEKQSLLCDIRNCLVQDFCDFAAWHIVQAAFTTQYYVCASADSSFTEKLKFALLRALNLHVWREAKLQHNKAVKGLHYLLTHTPSQSAPVRGDGAWMNIAIDSGATTTEEEMTCDFTKRNSYKRIDKHLQEFCYTSLNDLVQELIDKGNDFKPVTLTPNTTLERKTKPSLTLFLQSSHT